MSQLLLEEMILFLIHDFGIETCTLPVEAEISVTKVFYYGKHEKL
jgi:hypothetical protein